MKHGGLHTIALILFLSTSSASARPVVKTPEQRACERAKKLVTRFVELDRAGARLKPGSALDKLVQDAKDVPPRPLAVAREFEVVGCVANDQEAKVRVRYILQGIVQPPPEGSRASVLRLGKGAADQVFRVVAGPKGDRIADTDQIVPHVSPVVVADELRKEAQATRDREEQASLEAAAKSLEGKKR